MKLREELQKLQKQLEKTSKNSSLPPAKGFKAEVNNLEEIGKCGHCGQEQIAAIPVGMEAKSPFGDRIAALESI